MENNTVEIIGKTCGLCKKEIKEDARYAEIIDYDKKRIIKRAFYHRPCLNDVLRGQGQLLAKKIVKGSQNALKQLFKPSDKLYEIKLE